MKLLGAALAALCRLPLFAAALKLDSSSKTASSHRRLLDQSCREPVQHPSRRALRTHRLRQCNRAGGRRS